MSSDQPIARGRELSPPAQGFLLEVSARRCTIHSVIQCNHDSRERADPLGTYVAAKGARGPGDARNGPEG